ncbi:SDR family oxidoreductase [Aestuariicoccus sp. MJ-SS9]|uniref:SDR family oxidoreductase n=1 Tax=Aestuariicoccus sp. MJ-SS9 TaxID=3079855 RepID=UPI00290F9480|nr:SDR family oxidoreductase [Aestuariicoccus sp. MJ-SS9]MDU8911126.1 SDR family oxidoreductase [Aestuariicoccus sp. MJ-SS9]
MSRLLLVTGASAGIGAATARLAPAHGWGRVIVHYGRDLAGAEAVAADIRAEGAEAHVVQADVADPTAIAAMFGEIAALPPGPLDLVNNAGIVAPKGGIADLTPERVTQVFAVNVLGAIEVARQAVAYMRAHQGGGIVNVSSVAARTGSADEYIDYAASKGAIDSFTTGLADELAAEGIRVNTLRPGLTDTGIHAKGGQPDRLERLGHMPKLGRPGTAEEMAEGILWLLSDKASYVTRAVLDVSGGR